MAMKYDDDTVVNDKSQNENTFGAGTRIEPELMEQDTGFDYNGFMAFGGNINTANDHVQNMKKLMVESKYTILCIADGMKYPIIVYAKKVDNNVFYYPTITTDEDKKAMGLSSFVQGLSQKDADIYTLDVMYKQDEDSEVLAKLSETFPTVKEFKLVGTSVVRYSEETYNDISALITRALEAAPFLAMGKDLSLVNTPKDFKVFYNDIPSGVKISRTGMTVRADFKLTLSSNNKNARSSNNSTNKDVAYAYGYIDLVPEEDVQQQQYGAPIISKKLRPILILTDFFGLSATSGYALLSIITGASMLSRDMYMGYIMKHAGRFNDLIGVTLNENVDMNKLTPSDKADVLENLIMNPIMAIDVPNNGYLEEISYFLEGNANSQIKSAATKFLGKTYKTDFINYGIALPYVEYFDKTIKDIREVDCSKVASITKDIAMVLGYAKITNEAGQDRSQTVSNLATLFNEIAVDGEIIGTYARLFLEEDGLRDLINAANLNVTYSPLYEAPKTSQGFMRRSGYQNQGYYSNGGYRQNGSSRGYQAF